MFRLFECCALSFFERFVLSFSLKIERFVSDSAEIWICGLYIYAYEALKEELEQVEQLRFIFTSPTFIKDKSKKEKLKTLENN